ncbi:serine kinase [Merismopedia glauca]|uniref:Serine kinase n=1 Tax=Merismopedia glauca CCAP 1448/3 TaxID=1296344 RepID=A0A2T1C512_9CYAN|nr:serine kinase [Merismopedia glauca]PSB03314.1 serine kinase [Merismopedia glauca CCAP 1448/3]
MFAYTAYGLGIHSEIELPELISSTEVEADVAIAVQNLQPLPLEYSPNSTRIKADQNSVQIDYQNVGSFLVKDGNQIICSPALGVKQEALRLVILGSVIAILLHQKGRLILHSSAINLDGEAVAFLGGSGWGKSTTAAAFHQQGYCVVADDVIAVETEGNQPTIFPGFPRLKLWEEAAVYLGDEWESLPKLHPELPKRSRVVNQGFSINSLSLKRIYILAEGDELEIIPLAPQTAFRELIKHSYVLSILKNTGALGTHFQQCSQLTKTIPISRLVRGRSLDQLPAVTKIVAADLRNAIV